MNMNRWITTATAATLLMAAGAAQALIVVKRQASSSGPLLSNACSFEDGATDATLTGCAGLASFGVYRILLGLAVVAVLVR